MSDANGQAIAIRTTAAMTAWDFSPEQRKMIRDTYLSGATEAEAAVLLELARVRRLNPIAGQIHFVKRWNMARQCETWAAQVGIDGFRSIAEDTGKYDGQDEPEFEYDGKALKVCRVRIYRKDVSRAFVGRADFSEYVQTKKDGTPNSMWANKPHIMLAKCAEALAIRRAFPQQLSGLYAPEEMGHEEREVGPPAPTPPQEKKPSKSESLKAKLAAPIIDVQAGETEQQAEARQDPLIGKVRTGPAVGKDIAALTDEALAQWAEWFPKSDKFRDSAFQAEVRAEMDLRARKGVVA